MKLGCAIVFLTTGISSLSVVYFYHTTQQVILRQTQNSLKSLGHAGTLVFGEAEREAIARLIAEVQAATARDPQFTLAEAANLPQGQVVSTLTA